MTRTISILSGLTVAAVLAASAASPAASQMGGGPFSSAGQWIAEHPAVTAKKKNKGLSATKPGGKKARKRAKRSP